MTFSGMILTAACMGIGWILGKILHGDPDEENEGTRTPWRLIQPEKPLVTEAPEFDAERLKEALGKVISDTKPCPFCQHPEPRWSVDPRIYSFVSEPTDRSRTHERISMPVALVVCAHCSVVVPYTAVGIGLVKPGTDEPT